MNKRARVTIGKVAKGPDRFSVYIMENHDDDWDNMFIHILRWLTNDSRSTLPPLAAANVK